MTPKQEVENMVETGSILCDHDGVQPQTLVCQHIAKSLWTRKRVGFCWSNKDTSKWPDATCNACAELHKTLEGKSEKEVQKVEMELMNPQVLCAKCYERAKRLNLGWLGYYFHIYTPTLIWPDKKIAKQVGSQQEICKKYNTDFMPPDSEDIIGMSDNTNGRNMPINGMRHHAKDDSSGWYVYSGNEQSRADDFFKPHHIKHIYGRCPQIIKYLALPPGYRFQIDDKGYKHVWFDKN